MLFSLGVGDGRRGDTTLQADEKLSGTSAASVHNRFRDGRTEARIREDAESIADGSAQYETLRIAAASVWQTERFSCMERGCGEQ